MAAVLAVLWTTRTAPSSAAQVAALPAAPATTAVPTSDVPSPEPSASPTPDAGRPPAVRPPVTRRKVPVDAPAKVRIGAIGVDSVVVPVGVDDRGEMDVPEDVRTIGWYRYGATPGGGAGSAVLSGHVDDRKQGRGALFNLRDLGVGDPVEVEMGDGSRLAYRVAKVERIDKQALPVDRIFERGGPPHLTLVTCGGDFDRSTRNYLDNVVVTAEPVT